MVGLKEVGQCFDGFTALSEDRHTLIFAMRNSFSIGKGDLKYTGCFPSLPNILDPV